MFVYTLTFHVTFYIKSLVSVITECLVKHGSGVRKPQRDPGEFNNDPLLLSLPSLFLDEDLRRESGTGSTRSGRKSLGPSFTGWVRLNPVLIGINCHPFLRLPVPLFSMGHELFLRQYRVPRTESYVKVYYLGSCFRNFILSEVDYFYNNRRLYWFCQVFPSVIQRL